ncbi:MAG: tyrosinase family protein [Paludibacterium sp.]|uniref:tyrosinase family protein n=1 Tax=Paludibacterium sp. TaxID=1917523 RepID=UPI0025D623F0|nr:tyrosinase family protein [Paludibacterium sp.]MBV8046776.1 tyrosinase family protein [Paludibacterium sp.]MBV8649486.1 tyrosinase family protein [Paludibacterium sp.]
MTYTRRNVWLLGATWADPILWYARGVKAMQARALNQLTSWKFFAAIHGLDSGLWQQLGYLSASDPMPSKTVQATYWNQCQHGSWYFLPWHRGYLLAVEAILRAEIVKLGGPADWALPYWNYFKSGENTLPPAFASAAWPDGKDDNPLYIPQRYGPNNDGNVFVPLSQVNERALGDARFIGQSGGGSPGFGGVQTKFSHAGTIHGGIETQPHDWVHGLVGGSDTGSGLPGLMSDPDTAALDPVFWLHHGNIDRLWTVWRLNPASHIDPGVSAWLKGPATGGGRAFTLPKPDGSAWTYTPSQMETLATLGYTYDDLAPPAAAPITRLQQLGFAAAGAPSATGR